MKQKFIKIGSMFAMGAMIVIAASCTKEGFDLNRVMEYGASKEINVSAQIMTTRPEKAHMDGREENGIYKVIWDQGDQITVNNGVLNIVNINPVDSQIAVFTGSASPNQMLESRRHVYRSIYPASIIKSIPANATPMIVTLPTVQSYNGSSDQIDNNYMAAYSSVNASADVTSLNLRYKNLCSVLKVVLKAQPGKTGVDAQVSRIRLTSPEGMSGDFKVTFNSGNPVLTAVDGTPKNLTELVFSTPVDIKTEKTFFIMVPPIQNKALVMQIWNGDGTKLVQQETASATLNRSFVYTTTINTQFIDWVGPISVSNSQKVYFAHGNLKYHFTNNQWRFFDNQYDMLLKSLVENTLSTNDSSQLGRTWFVGVPKGSNATQSQFQRVYDRANNIIRRLNQWTDHFCFGTSGEDPSGTRFRQPWHTFYGSVRGKADETNGYLYGPMNSNSAQSLTGTYANGDWGVYHRSELNSSLSPVTGDWRTQRGDWRTLTQPEWYYCITGAKRLDVIDNSKKCALARIEVSARNYVNGLMLIPDKWHWYFMPENISFTPNDRGGFADNTYTLAQWRVLDRYGAVFLPAAGARLSIVMHYGEAGYYQSATAATKVYEDYTTGWNHKNQRGYAMYFFSATAMSSLGVDPALCINSIVPPNAVEGAFNKIDGLCVRLVRNTSEQ